MTDYPIEARSGFGRRRDPFPKPGQPEEYHVGRDFRGPVGTPFPAESSGVVIYSGPAGGFNHAVTIRSPVPAKYRERYGDWYDTTYGHLDPQTAVKYEKGRFVNAGEIIGTIGAVHGGEKSTGPHAHVQITTDQRFQRQHLSPDYDPAHPARVNFGSSGGLGYSTGQRHLFEDPGTFEGWTDGAPFDIVHFEPRYAGHQAPSLGPPSGVGPGPGSGVIPDPGWPFNPNTTDQRGPMGTGGELKPIANPIDDPLYPFNSFRQSADYPARPPAPAALTDWLGPGLGTLSSRSFPDSLRDPAMSSGYYSDGRFVPTPHVRDLPITYVRPYADGQMPTSAGPLPSFDSAWWLSPELRSITGIDGPSAQTARSVPPARSSAFDDLPLPSPLMGGGTTPAPQSYPASPLDMTSYDWRTGRWATSPAPGDQWPGGRGELPFPMQGLPPFGTREEDR